MHLPKYITLSDDDQNPILITIHPKLITVSSEEFLSMKEIFNVLNDSGEFHQAFKNEFTKQYETIIGEEFKLLDTSSIHVYELGMEFDYKINSRGVLLSIGV